MNEAQRIIAEVKKHECLWNTSHIYDKDVKGKAWQKVYEALHPNWDSLSVEEKINEGNDVQRKWKNFRDSFKKELKKQKGQKNTEKLKKYKYYDDLLFLMPDSHASTSRKSETKIHPKKREYTLEEDDSDSNNTLSLRKRILRESRSSSIDYGDVHSRTSSSYGLNKTKRSFEKHLNDSSNFVQECKPENISNVNRIGTESSGDEDFFKSLLPSVQKFNDDQKLNFRIEVLNILKNIRRRSRMDVQ